MIDITKIVLVVLYLCFSAITLYLIPWIKSRTSVKQQELIVGIAKTAVYAAQQLYDKEAVDVKKAYAMERVESELTRYNIKLSTDDISTYIEGALKDIKTSLADGGVW